MTGVQTCALPIYKMGGDSNVSGVALKNALIDLVNRAHMKEYGLKPIPVNIQFYNQDLFLISKDKDFNLSSFTEYPLFFNLCNSFNSEVSSLIKLVKLLY